MRRFVILAFVILSCISGFSQAEPFVVEWPGAEIPSPYNGTYHYNAIEKIVLSPGEGMVFEADADNRMEFYLDSDLLVPLSEVYSDFPSSDDAYVLNQNLPVGSFDGNYTALSNGALGYELPIELPSGINGLIPGISLAYNSYGSNGLLGKGWALSAGQSSVSRMTRSYHSNGVTRAIELTKDDNLQLDGVRLIHIEGNYGEDGSKYKPENNLHDYVVIHGNGEGTKSLELFKSNGIRVLYGNTENSCLKTEDGSAKILWRVSRIIDQFGNYIEYQYSDDRSSRILAIKYTGNDSPGSELSPLNTIEFIYGERSDPNTSYVGGSSIYVHHLLKRISIKSGTQLYAQYDFDYGYSHKSFLTGVTKTVGGEHYHPTQFFYNHLDNVEATTMPASYNASPSGQTESTYVIATPDINGDGLADIIKGHKTSSGHLLRIEYHINSGSPYYQFNNVAYLNVVGAPDVDTYVRYGDLNGDSFLDVVVEYTHKWTNEDHRKITSMGVSIFDGVNSFTSTSISFDNYDQIVNWEERNGSELQIGDFDGDGADELALFTRLSAHVEDDGLSSFSVLYNYEGGSFTSSTIEASNLKYIGEARNTAVIDFNGDGKKDIMMRTSEHINTTEIYELTFNPVDGKYHQNQLYHSQDNGGFANSEDWDFGDFNGDGKIDLIENGKIGLSTGAGEYIKRPMNQLLSEEVVNQSYSYNCWDVGSANAFTQNFDYVLDFSNSDIYPMDINGDGLTDIVIDVIYKFDGTLDHFNSIYNPTDLGVICSNEENGNLSYFVWSSPIALISTGLGFTETSIPDIQDYHVPDLLTPTDDQNLYGDFNGDSRTDLMLIDESGTSSIKLINDDREAENLNRVMNGFGVALDFSYERINHPTAEVVMYEDDFEREDPFRPFRVPLYVVAQASTNNPDGSLHYTSYRYKNPTLHRKGRGFVGFSERSTYDSNTSKRSIEKYNLNVDTDFNDLFQVCLTYAPDEGDPEEDELMSLTETLSLENVSQSGIHNSSIDPINVEFKFSLPLSSKDENHIAGRRKITTVTYDAEKKVNTQTEVVESMNNNSIVETTLTDYDYEMPTGEWWAAYKNTRLTVTKTRTENNSSGEAAHVRKTENSYDGTTGSLLSSVADPGTNISVTSSTTYDNYGNVATSTISSAGLHSEQTSFTYDASHRFQTSVTNHLNETSSTSYHDLWGLPIVETDRWGNSVEMAYDGMGRLVSATDPYGNTVETEWNWIAGLDYSTADVMSAADARYEEVVTSTASPFLKKRFNRYGQLREVITQDRNGAEVYVYTSYNTRGLEETVTDAHYSGQVDVRTTRTLYDNYDRVSDVIVSDPVEDLHSTIAYNQEGPLYLTHTTSFDGTWKKVYHDASDKMVKSIDAGGTLLFEYWNDNNPRYTRLEGQTDFLAYMEYDEAGRQTLLHDPNAGKTEYLHDAYGRLTYQSDAKGNAYTLNYDPNDGRLMGKIYDDPALTGTNNGTYSYTYVGSGHGLNLIESETAPNGDAYSYTYDEYGRMTSTTKTINSEQFVTSYDYDGLGRNHRTTFPGSSSPMIEYIYDPVLGHTNEVLWDGQTVWSNAVTNARGQFTQYERSDGHTLNHDYDYHGLPARSYTDDLSIHDRSYTIDAANGNLTERSDNRLHLFDYDIEYDELNRLQDWQSASTNGASPNDGGVIQLPHAPMSITYADNGNISAKTDAGTYAYTLQNTSSLPSTNMVHAVSSISDPNQLTAQDAQDITYTGFNSVSTISQGAHNYLVHYGPDDQRSRTVMHTDEILVHERIYAGSYERQTLGDGSIQEVYYITAPDGIAGIYVYESGSGEIFTPYVDHLGSIVSITNSQGSILLNGDNEVRLDYDPWARHRSPDDWSYLSDSPYADGTAPSWLWRGYTGHEMLPEFGLINMNGRCYDPLLGRMLSVDNYVSDATSTQAYNRYSYVLNNPLKYTDPSGESPLAGAAIGALIYTAQVGFSSGGFDNWNWTDFAVSTVMGAAGGAFSAQVGAMAKASGFSAAGKVVFQTLAHATFGGLSTAATGGSGLNGAVASALSSLVATGVGIGARNWSSGMRNVSMIASGGLTGGLSQAIGGGDFWKGARNGLIIAALNHVAHQTGKEDLYKKKGGYTEVDETISVDEFLEIYEGMKFDQIAVGEEKALWIKFANQMSQGGRYVELSNGRTVDMLHFLVVGEKGSFILGWINEAQQYLKGKESGMNPDDFYSNELGIEFFDSYESKIETNETMIANYIHEYLSNPRNLSPNNIGTEVPRISPSPLRKL